MSLVTFPPCVSMQHEKYTSQLQLSIKALEAKAKEKQQLHGLDKIKGSVTNVRALDRAERRANSLTGTRLPIRRNGKADTSAARPLLSPENRRGGTFSRRGQKRVFLPRVQRRVTPTERSPLLLLSASPGCEIRRPCEPEPSAPPHRELAGRVLHEVRAHRGLETLKKLRTGGFICVRHAWLQGRRRTLPKLAPLEPSGHVRRAN